ncbi:membrane protein [Sediminicola sp. YIK13]|uniref:hypothetical protein n=1 Tax=Sediminicola sp. YIK13 TaxID=1453352 RepID=UPI0007205026|nr:hypothetical protein [Sediminicola sp. YIK13]ALM08827.1 membrane protein [Sediminicola sp. YIK13]
MKRFETYKNIRKRALIWGLPLSLFALQLLSILGSLLVIIFSFSLLVILGTISANSCLYVVFTRLINQPQLLHYQKVFPKNISNKQISPLKYE